VQWRSERDAALGDPRLLHQALQFSLQFSLQFNIRGGSLPEVMEGALRLLRAPVKVPAARMWNGLVGCHVSILQLWNNDASNAVSSASLLVMEQLNDL